MKKKFSAAVLAALMLTLTGCGRSVPNMEDTPFAITTAVTTAAKTTTAVSTKKTGTTTAESETTVSSTETQTETAAPTAPTAAATAPPTEPPTQAPTEAPTAAPTTENSSDWELKLVNKTHNIGDYAPPELTTLANGTQVDSRIYPDLQAMFDDMYSAGYSPYVREGYRTYAEQKEIMDTRIQRHLAEGYSQEGAVEMAEKYVAIPGTSEHHLGLAVDINAADGNEYGLYWWLSEYAYQYGFILRYTEGGESITGYDYEPWHYRYVGKEAADYIHEKGITLEEYLNQ